MRVFAAKALFLVGLILVSLGGSGVNINIVSVAPVPLSEPHGIHEGGD